MDFYKTGGKSVVNIESEKNDMKYGTEVSLTGLLKSVETLNYLHNATAA